MKITLETIDDILVHFFQEKPPWVVSTGKSGYNNTTRYVSVEDKKYILRVYETHKDASKVELEHEVLVKLSEGAKLPFQVPVPVPAANEKTLVRLQDGSNRIACLYQYIEGENPKFESREVVSSFGSSSALLLQAMEKINLEQPFVYRPYYEIENAYPNCPIEQVVKWCNTPPEEFLGYSIELKKISDQIVHFINYVPQLKRLPHQLIHGDLNESNVLIGNDHSINAILDFEFATRDLRVMEAAVCIAEIAVKEPNLTKLHEKIQIYLSAFSSIISLTTEEKDALPLLITLRRLDVFVHFLARYLDGIDQDHILKEQIVKTNDHLYWLEDTGRQLLGLEYK
jgi:homoserine kinase type II